MYCTRYEKKTQSCNLKIAKYARLCGWFLLHVAEKSGVEIAFSACALCVQNAQRPLEIARNGCL